MPFEEKVNFFVKNTLRQRGGVMFTLHSASCSIQNFSCWYFSNRMRVLMVGNTILTL